MEIVPLRIDHFAQVVSLGEYFATELGEPFSREKAIQVLDAIELHHGESTFGEVLVCDGGVVGVFLAALSEDWFSYKQIAGELLWYVHPDYRGNRKGLELYFRAKKWAEMHGCKLRMAHFHNYGNAGDLEAFYEREGLEPFETTYQ